MLKRTAAVVLALALSIPGAYAAGIVNIDSDQPATVIVDGEEVGATPITVRDLAPGYHTIRLENPRTQQFREFNFYSPKRSSVEKDIRLTWADVPPPVIHTQPVGEPVYAAPPPPEPPKKDNTKARMRNTMLGIGLVNEVFNKGGSKGGVRKGVVGAGLLNELINK
ncbi:MAG: PEGA domain-containing protein [Candidatus Wallbacteria bacterium]|nr:PEGA domain-containing protein [Candidatus Wallbacteria bacterium]